MLSRLQMERPAAYYLYKFESDGGPPHSHLINANTEHVFEISELLEIGKFIRVVSNFKLTCRKDER